MNPGGEPATKSDVENAIREITPRIVEGVVDRIVTKRIDGATSTILGAVGDQFSTVIGQLDEMNDKVDRVEHKVDNISDDLGTRVSKLEKQKA